MNFKPYLIVVGLFFLTGCVVVDIPANEPISKEIVFENLCSNNMYGVGQEGIVDTTLLINSEAQLNGLLTMMNSVNPSGCDNELQEINFDENTVVLIVDTQKGSGGHLVQINSILSTNDGIKIDWSSKSPEGNASSVMTQPFSFSIIEKTELEATFIKN